MRLPVRGLGTPPTYESNFKDAIAFARALGLPVTDLPKVAGELVNSENGQKVMGHIQEAGITSFKRSAMQCVKWNHALRPLVEEALGCRVVLTLGRLFYRGQSVFNPSVDDLAKWYRQGFQVEDFAGRVGFNLHAWYTLPTMEVLDLTLCSSIAAVKNSPDLEGMVIGGWPDDMAETHGYVPLVVGDEYIEEVSRKSIVPLLASGLSQAELDAWPVAVVLG